MWRVFLCAILTHDRGHLMQSARLPDCRSGLHGQIEAWRSEALKGDEDMSVGDSESTGREQAATELARATRTACREASHARRDARKRRRLLLLRGLDATLFGHRMPEAAFLAEQVGWHRDCMDDSCVKCGTTLFRFESREGGCGECRGRRALHEAVIRLGRYAPPLSQWVPAVKSRAWFSMAHHLGRELGQQARDAVYAGRLPQPELVTWVPVHWIRRLWRGIDHAQTIARATANELGVPCCSLLAARWSRGQVHGDRRQRTSNAGRFHLKRGVQHAMARHILLVDDVQTTGTTAQDAFRALQDLRPKSLSLAVCAVSDPPRRNALRASQSTPRGPRWESRGEANGGGRPESKANGPRMY